MPQSDRRGTQAQSARPPASLQQLGQGDGPNSIHHVYKEARHLQVASSAPEHRPYREQVHQHHRPSIEQKQRQMNVAIVPLRCTSYYPRRELYNRHLISASATSHGAHK